MYTSLVTISSQNVWALLEAAKCLQLGSLQKTCEVYITEQITKNAKDSNLTEVADKIDLPPLQVEIVASTPQPVPIAVIPESALSNEACTEHSIKVDKSDCDQVEDDHLVLDSEDISDAELDMSQVGNSLKLCSLQTYYDGAIFASVGINWNLGLKFMALF